MPTARGSTYCSANIGLIRYRTGFGRRVDATRRPRPWLLDLATRPPGAPHLARTRGVAGIARGHTVPAAPHRGPAPGHLSSQMDMGEPSRAHKVAGRERIRIHPENAAEGGLADGDVVRVSHSKGECLAGVLVTANIRRDVVELPTGAWFDPQIVDGTESASTETPCAHHGPKHFPARPRVLRSTRPRSGLASGN
ncbi:hypothetical protein EH165_12785 [Nakamurella antarctica]|uniref:Molybdopterin dinucleotide-binding domain-containing protein n=1 Tax=Nakamurella antarctica TaxID=1902245 RepID=A0A3G8ZQ07_9ACTN|nr:hypothetical protein EH165_12785 [Nakamurella antarctica]